MTTETTTRAHEAALEFGEGMKLGGASNLDCVVGAGGFEAGYRQALQDTAAPTMLTLLTHLRRHFEGDPMQDVIDAAIEEATS